MAKIGGIHQNLPALANARHVLTTLAGGQQKEKNAPGLDDDDVRGLGGMGRQCSLRETFLAIRKPELERQLALQKAELSKNGKPSSEPTSRESCRMP